MWHSQENLTDGGGLVVLRRLFDVLHLGRWIDTRSGGLGGYYRPSLLVEVWVTLLLDSTVSVRYGEQQAGAERGYNPHKPGRPSHHPLLAFLQETGDGLGVRWRPGNAHTAEGAEAWVTELVAWLRAQGVEAITVRLDKGFFSRSIVETLEALEVDFLLKVPNHEWLQNHHRGRWRPSKRGEAIRSDGETWTASGELWGVRLLSLHVRRSLAEADDCLALDTYEVTDSAHILTNIEGIHVLSAWRAYNRGARVEQRIKELGQLSVGETAVDDLDGNALLWTLGTLAYQLLHVLRTVCLTGEWQSAQPKRLRRWVFALHGKLTTHARKHYVQLLRDEPLRPRLLAALRTLAGNLPPPLIAG